MQRTNSGSEMRQRGSASASEVELDDAKEDEALLRKNMSMNQLTKLVESVSAQRDDDAGDDKKQMRTAEDVRLEFQLLEAPIHRRQLPASEKTEAELEEESWSTRAKGLLPILEWAPKYGKDCKYHAGSGDPFRENMRRDVIAGVVIGIMLVPQGMAYALLAGLPPIYGLYSSTWTLVAYMCFGTCRLLGPGVNAPISLLVADALSETLLLKTTCEDDIASADCKYFIEQSLLLCLMVGVLYLVMAACNLGIVTAFMPEPGAWWARGAPRLALSFLSLSAALSFCCGSPSRAALARLSLSLPALSGFTTGAAAIIITSNIKLFLGMSVPRGGVVYTWLYIFKHIGEMSGWTLLMGIFAFACLDRLKWLNGKKWVKKKLPIPIPEQLVVLILTTLIAWAFNLQKNAGLGVIGDIPSGLYVPQLPPISVARVSEIASPAVTVALVTYILTINVGKAVGSKHNINVDATQELVALAAQSVVGAVTGSCVPSGSFSRTALIAQLGAESAVHNAVSCVVVMLVSLTLTGSLFHLPKATLAAIIFMALKAMINIDTARFLYGVSKREWGQWMVAFLVTTFGGVTLGIVASIGLSIILLLKQASRPSTAVLGVLPGTDVFVSVKRYPAALELPGIKVFRFDGALTFANKDWFEERLQKMDRQDTNARTHEKPISVVIIDCSSVRTIDTSAVRLLERVINAYAKIGRSLLFANWRGVDQSGLSVLQHLKFHDIISKDKFFLTIADAVVYAATLRADDDAGPSEEEKSVILKSQGSRDEQLAEMVELGEANDPDQHTNKASVEPSKDAWAQT